jgi:hypothetical protein
VKNWIAFCSGEIGSQISYFCNSFSHEIACIINYRKGSNCWYTKTLQKWHSISITFLLSIFPLSASKIERLSWLQKVYRRWVFLGPFPEAQERHKRLDFPRHVGSPERLTTRTVFGAGPTFDEVATTHTGGWAAP